MISAKNDSITMTKRVSTLVFFVLASTLPVTLPALAQREGGGEGGEGPIHTPRIQPQVVVPPPPPPPPPPKTTPPPPRVQGPFNFTNVQTDFQPTMGSFPGANSASPDVNMPALDGVLLLPNKDFPKEDDLQGPVSGIMIKWREGSRFHKVNDFVINFDSGEILVSVKRPSKTALLKTPLGKCSIGSNGDALVSLRDGVLRITNIDALGNAIKGQFELDKHGKQSEVTVAVKPGYELVAGEEKLTRSDMRPRDGLARRRFKVVENGKLAISEISIERIMQVNDLIAELRQATTGTKERRVLGDMSKMAAVLNYKNGVQGFVVDESKLAGKEQKPTQ